MIKIFAVSLTAVLLAAGPTRSADNPYGISPEHDQILRQGFHELFNLEFAAAEQTLARLKNRSEHHPIFDFAQVIRHWWWLSVHVLEIDDAKSRAFIAAADETLKRSEKRAAGKDKKGEAHLVMGTTLGLMSRWSAANRAWLPAYLRGKKSATHLQRALELNPAATDAYMTLGVFNYAKDMLRKRTEEKNENAEGSEEPELGITQLRKAYESGVYFREAAGLMLAGILANIRPKEALPIITDLRTRLPANAVLHMLQISALYNAGERGAMKNEVESYRTLVASGVYAQTFESPALFAAGLWAFGERRWAESADLLGQAAAAGTEENPYHTWSLLYQGYAFDAMKQRTKAKKNYRAVLACRRRYASHDHAQRRLYKPFLPSDIETRKLEL